MPNNRQRSESHDFEHDSDSDSQSQQAGKPGRKKNPNSQAARRDQNRIAQREFRLRKQQRIRDLEARVEILSGGKDEAMGEMRLILKDLMQENQTLRNLLRSLSNFIGEGAGGLLPKLGWDLSDFNNFLNRSETDTAWEGYQRRKKTGPATPGQNATAGSSSTSAQSHKRPSEDDMQDPARKKQKNQQSASDPQTDYSLLLPMNPMSNDSHPLYGNANSRSSYDNVPFNMLRPATGSPLFMQQPSPPSNNNANSTFSGSVPTPPGPGGYNDSYMTSLGLNSSTSSNTLSTVSFPSPQQQQQQASTTTPSVPTSTTEDDDAEDSSKNEAYKLISYHLDNYKRNTAYCLPSSLRPSLVQRTVPHESVIDRILHPELRDRMILLRGRFDLVDCLLDYRNAVTIHGDDVLNHANWEINEKWLKQYGFLVDHPTLNVTNRWRRERGEPEIRLTDIAPADQGAPPITT